MIGRAYGSRTFSRLVSFKVISGFTRVAKTIKKDSTEDVFKGKDGEAEKLKAVSSALRKLNVAGIVKEKDDTLVPLSNGCICCTLKVDLMKQIVELVKSGRFDYILIEASGICEPLPIAQTITVLEEQTKAHIHTF